MDPEKRQLRKLKRDLKKAGSKRRRQFLKRELNENPEDAPHSEFERALFEAYMAGHCWQTGDPLPAQRL